MMDKKEAYRILTDNNQNILDSTYPLQFNKKWVEAYHIAVDNLKEGGEYGIYDNKNKFLGK